LDTSKDGILILMGNFIMSNFTTLKNITMNVIHASISTARIFRFTSKTYGV